MCQKLEEVQRVLLAAVPQTIARPGNSLSSSDLTQQVEVIRELHYLDLQNINCDVFERDVFERLTMTRQLLQTRIELCYNFPTLSGHRTVSRVIQDGILVVNFSVDKNRAILLHQSHKSYPFDPFANSPSININKETRIGEKISTYR